MIIEFSRHSKRRAKLYGISEATIRKILQSLNLNDGQHEIVKNISGFEFPIKVVAFVKEEHVMVITNYPLKKGKTK